MKPYLVVWTRTAIKKLTDLLDWLAERSPDAADKAQRRIMEKVGRLSYFPRMVFTSGQAEAEPPFPAHAC